MKGFVFNNIHSDEMGLVMESYQIQPVPEMENKTHNIEGRVGSLDKGFNFKDRQITIQVSMIGDYIEDVHAKLRGLFSKYNLFENAMLSFDDIHNTYYKARLTSSFVVDKKHDVFKFELEFTCFDPIAYGNKVSIDLKKDNEFLVNGSFDTSPVFTFVIDDPVSSLKVTQTNTGKFVKVNGYFNTGDIVTMDLTQKQFRCRKNGVVIHATLNSDFFILKIGLNKITTLPSLNNMTMEYNERWLY